MANTPSLEPSFNTGRPWLSHDILQVMLDCCINMQAFGQTQWHTLAIGAQCAARTKPASLRSPWCQYNACPTRSRDSHAMLNSAVCYAALSRLRLLSLAWYVICATMMQQDQDPVFLKRLFNPVAGLQYKMLQAQA